MGPKPPAVATDHDLFRLELVNIIDARHELVRLGELIDWSVFDREFGAQFVSTTGRPALPTRLVTGLLYLFQQERALEHRHRRVEGAPGSGEGARRVR